MRKLATVRTIDAIDPIPDADAIEVATVGGWKVVAKKGEFKKGDRAIYIEVDSWVPYELAPFLSRGKEPREYEGVKGERLKTVKLRGQLSQGLLIPCRIEDGYVDDGMDVTEALGILKWEPPSPAQLAGTVRWTFPCFIPKTGQERIQNLTTELQGWLAAGTLFEVTEKLEGSSMTAYLYNGEFGVCSRNIDLKEAEGNAFWQVARKMQLEEILRSVGGDLALQGELIGPGIQGNIYKLTEPQYRVFDVYDIHQGHYLLPFVRRGFCGDLKIPHVPVLFREQPARDIEDMLKEAHGYSALHLTFREGLVYKAEALRGCSFKVISNAYLLKGN